VSPLTLAHLSDLHFGRDAEVEQIEALEELIPSLHADAVLLSGDLTQRARHGELQRARAFVQLLARSAPTLAIPGNHDVQWWRSPLSLLGTTPRYRKFRRYFGPELCPTLTIPGAVIASALTSFGVSIGAMTWNPNDMAVKGYLPRSEAIRVKRTFQQAEPGAIRALAVHHNVLRGGISKRMGLARWRQAQRRLRETGVELILCGHDHQEGAGQLAGGVVISTAGTHTTRTRGGRPSAFNVISVDPSSIGIQHMRWDGNAKRFVAADLNRFGRTQRRKDATTE
jgi:3',5'-cyclic AMP phosphodiesterase CpdA